MRIYNLDEFLKLPEGIIFCSGTPWFFGPLSRKGKSLMPDDFYCNEYPWVDAQNSGEAFARLDEMLQKGASYPMETAEGRDASYDPEQIFMVFEPADLRIMIEEFTEALQIQEASAAINDSAG